MSNETDHQQSAGVEQKINEMVQQSKILEAYMNDIVTKEAAAVRLMEEARLASAALQSIVDEKEVESLIPVGIGIYMRASIPHIDKLLVNVGAGVTIEKGKQDAINYIESRIKEFEVALRQLAGQKQQIEMRMAQIQGQINQMLQQASQTGHGTATGSAGKLQPH
jgi:prefoldin alpha subunit